MSWARKGIKKKMEEYKKRKIEAKKKESNYMENNSKKKILQRKIYMYSVTILQHISLKKKIL